jgi:predicted metalloprotease
MRWRGERQSDNIEDRRGMPLTRGIKIGGLSGLALIIIVLISMLFGVDPTYLLQGLPLNHRS